MKILLTGASGGLGRQIKSQWDGEVISMGINPTDDIVADFKYLNEVENELYDALPVEGVIHCAGKALLSPNEKLDADDIIRLMKVNALSNFVINRELIYNCSIPPKFIIHICSDAAEHPMTHSLAYNVSKAAQLMIMKQMARERPPPPVIFAVSPGKIAGTGMSDYIDEAFPPLRGMTPAEGRKYLLSGLRVGELDAVAVARFVCDLAEWAVQPGGKFLHGHNIPMGGAR